MKRKHPARSKPCIVACVSLNFTPSRYKTLWLYARIKALSARILNICSVVTRVHLPCLMMWHTERKRHAIVQTITHKVTFFRFIPPDRHLLKRSDRSKKQRLLKPRKGSSREIYSPHMVVESFDVNGDAMLASPSLTTCAFSSSSISFNICASFFCAEWKVCVFVFVPNHLLLLRSNESRKKCETLSVCAPTLVKIQGTCAGLSLFAAKFSPLAIALFLAAFPTGFPPLASRSDKSRSFLSSCFSTWHKRKQSKSFHQLNLAFTFNNHSRKLLCFFFRKMTSCMIFLPLLSFSVSSLSFSREAFQEHSPTMPHLQSMKISHHITTGFKRFTQPSTFKLQHWTKTPDVSRTLCTKMNSPTCACFNAPTSLVPSPHIKV